MYCDIISTNLSVSKVRYGKTSAERMKKLREKRKADPEYDTEKFKEKERKRIARYRNIRKEKRSQQEIEEYRKNERLRKRKQREKQKEVAEKYDGQLSSNIKSARKRKARNNKVTRDEINNLKLRVKLFSNENRRLKRKLNSSVQSEVVEQFEDSSSSTDPESALLANLPPSAKSMSQKKIVLAFTC